MPSRVTAFLLALVLAFTFAPAARAQQNFFNVPASDVTARGKIFFQQQVNVLTTQRKLQSNSHFAFGLPWDLEVGFNVSHVNVKPFERRVLPTNTRNRSEPYNPLFLLTAQKEVRFSENFFATVGTQTGINMGAAVAEREIATLTYLNAVVTLPHPHARLVVGAYYGNDIYLGSGAGVGVWAGAEVDVLPGRVHLVADWISGRHDLGLGVVGANVFLRRDVSVVFGPILPNPGSGNGTGYVFELNVLDVAGLFKRPS